MVWPVSIFGTLSMSRYVNYPNECNGSNLCTMPSRVTHYMMFSVVICVLQYTSSLLPRWATVEIFDPDWASCSLCVAGLGQVVTHTQLPCCIGYHSCLGICTEPEWRQNPAKA